MQLNEKQKEVTEALKGQVLVVSCPGSGKTTSMIARANALVTAGVNPSRILIITFSKEAAVGMEAKYKQTFGDSMIHFGTIHAICFEVLRNVDGYSREDLFTETEKWAFFSTLLHKRIRADMMEDYIKNVISAIGYVKNRCMPPETYTSDNISTQDFCNCYYRYEEYKRNLGKIDFDDMLLLTRDIFLKKPAILELYKKKYEYIMIDEYQDTNRVQADIFYMLAGENGNLCVVGDDDQSIYGFRSADSTIMLDFPKKYKNCKVIYLDTNYRSEPDIVTAAGRLISNNRVRFKKQFLAAKKGSGVITKVSYKDVSEQRDGVLRRIDTLHKAGTPYQEMAILYRTNKQNQLYVQKLMKYDVPFYTTEAVSDYHNDFPFMDFMAYYRLSEGCYKRGDLQRILNRPSRYLKSEPFKNVNFDLDELLSACQKLPNSSAAMSKIYDLWEDVAALRGKKPKEFLDYLFHIMGYRDAAISFAEYCGKDEKETEELLDLLIDEAQEFESMEEWGAYAEQYAKKLQEKRKKKEGICLSTYHASKGLEWDKVFLIDCNEGVAPFKKAEAPEEIEEERRLFYVAFTRARNEVRLSYIQSQGSRSVIPSRFLAELGLISSAVTPKDGEKTMDAQAAKAKLCRKFYAVKKGYRTGIVYSWKECEAMIKGYRNPVYRRFDTQAEAEAFMEN